MLDQQKKLAIQYPLEPARRNHSVDTKHLLGIPENSPSQTALNTNKVRLKFRHRRHPVNEQLKGT
jgi:hypothetical protein